MQETSLISLVYVSSAVGAPTQEDILQILRVSRQNNVKENITGMLLYKGGNFMQVLEGPEHRVRALVKRIGADPRHRGVLTLIEKRPTERSFGNWSMAFQNLDTFDGSNEEAWSPFLSSSLLDEQFRSQPEACYKLLLSFKSAMR